MLLLLPYPCCCCLGCCCCHAPAAAAAAPCQSFLIEISAIIANKKDEVAGGYLVDKIVDKTGAKGTGERGRGM
jgi:hypothetical protein